MPIRVTIVEDDARVREALVDIINEAPGLRCAANVNPHIRGVSERLAITFR